MLNKPKGDLIWLYQVVSTEYLLQEWDLNFRYQEGKVGRVELSISEARTHHNPPHTKIVRFLSSSYTDDGMRVSLHDIEIYVNGEWFSLFAYYERFIAKKIEKDNRKILNIQLPTIGYHVTYLDRVPLILEKGLRNDMPRKLKTGCKWERGRVYFIIHPALAYWAAIDRSLENKASDKDLVILRADGLNPEFIVADGDWGNTPQESIYYGGTFAYSKAVPPELIDVYAVELNNDSFISECLPQNIRRIPKLY